MTPSSSPRAAHSSATHGSYSTTRSNTTTANSTQQLGQHVVSTQPAASNDAEQIITKVTQQIIASRPPAPHPDTDSVPIAPPPDWIDALLHAEKTGVSPLNRAIIEGDFELAQLLMKNDARANASIEPGISSSSAYVQPLFDPAQVLGDQRSSNLAVVNFALHKLSVAPHAEISYLGANALTLAILCKVPGAFFLNLCMHAKKQDKSILEKQDAAGRTPLGVAVANGDIDHVRALLMIGVNPNTKTHNKKTPLLLAIANGNTQLMLTLLKAGANSHDKRGINIALKLCFDKRKYVDFSAYQACSDLHRVEVFKFCARKIASILKSGTDNDLLDFLQAASSLVTDRRLAKLAVKAAKIPGALTKMMILIGSMQGPLTPKQGLALREAAARSGDGAIYDYAVRLDTHLIELIKNSKKPGPKKQEVLNEELERALDAHSTVWVNELIAHGAKFDASPTIYDAYPLLAKLADSGEHALLEKQAKKVGIVELDSFAQSIFKATRTEAGFILLLSVYKPMLQKTHRLDLDEMLSHAVKLGSIESVKMLVELGADLNTHELYRWSDPYANQNKVLNMAIAKHDVAMVRYLIEAGARPTKEDVNRFDYDEGGREIYELLAMHLPDH